MSLCMTLCWHTLTKPPLSPSLCWSSVHMALQACGWARRASATPVPAAWATTAAYSRQTAAASPPTASPAPCTCGSDLTSRSLVRLKCGWDAKPSPCLDVHGPRRHAGCCFVRAMFNETSAVHMQQLQISAFRMQQLQTFADHFGPCRTQDAALQWLIKRSYEVARA